MAFRMSASEGIRFDERLVLYGWLEDKEFSRKAARNGRLVECQGLVGVHLGLQSGRVSGKKYGYSQIVNAWYLYQKRALSGRGGSLHILKALLANAAKTFPPGKPLHPRRRPPGQLVRHIHPPSAGCPPERTA